MDSDDTPGLWGLLRPLAFRLDPERAHRLALALLSRWSAVFGGQLPTGDLARRPALRRRLMGLDFPNPVGLAAGLDKEAAAVPAWQRMGFGFVEVGTVTALPQPGNPRPRMFRLPADGAIVNRMGFNNGGAAAMQARLTRLRARGVLQVPLGVNLGKSKVTPAQLAAQDYRASFERLAELADYIVVNLSSPNTPGLRDLQTVDEVRRIVDAIQVPNQALSRPRPLLVKLAPDLADADAIACGQAALEAGCAGLILTNTTIRFEGLKTPTAGPERGAVGATALCAQHGTPADGARGTGAWPDVDWGRRGHGRGGGAGEARRRCRSDPGLHRAGVWRAGLGAGALAGA